MDKSTDDLTQKEQHTRRCRQCGDETMAIDAIKVDVWGVEHQFVCPACGHKVTLASSGGLGFYLAAALVAIGVIALVMGLGNGFSRAEILVLALLFVLFFSPALFDALKRRRYPQTAKRLGASTHKTAVTATQKKPVQKGMLWLDRLGLVRGFFSLFAILALWFVFWAAFGLLRDNFF
jgi:uncharacterized protein (DUF983 family)